VDRGPDIVVAGFKAGARADAGGLGYQVEQMQTLTSAESGTQKPTVAIYGVGVDNGVAGTLDAHYYKGQGEREGTERTAVCAYSFDSLASNYTAGSFAGYTETEKSGSLKASGGDIGGGSESIVCQKTVRRLTPTECERLQGLLDGYTLINDKTCSDTARYKALGNGMAQPCADYIIRRIKEARS
jgi:DNA (cytosine-5)-methyltransferase 1